MIRVLIGLFMVFSQGCGYTPPVKESLCAQVPSPASVQVEKGKPFMINQNTEIIYPVGKTELLNGTYLVMSEIEKQIGVTFKTIADSKGTTAKGTTANRMIYRYDPTLKAEAFRLSVNADSVVVVAKDAAGFFYGAQSLFHALLQQKQKPYLLPAIQIEDHPEMAYRGAMLDVSRHFFSVGQVKRFIDLLAMHRLNYFHWHLTDDQGWRIEIKKYPELTRVGAWRGKDENRYGGFYTQEEIKEVVAYAAKRSITIIPEIDLPGHTTAALAAYPQLACVKRPYEVSLESGGVHKDVVCLGQEFSWQFAKDVLKEVADLFPSSYLHIGGDEVPRDRWKACSRCQDAIRQYGLKETDGHSPEDLLQGKFNEQMALYLKGLGKKMIGWDEVLSHQIDPETVIMSWRGLGRGVQAMKKGHPVIFSSNGHFYLNNYQSSDMGSEPKATGGLVLMQKLYEAELMVPETTDQQRQLALGAEICLWTSYVPDDETLDYMMLPRLAAFSEFAWSGSRRGRYVDFLERLPIMIDLYRKLGYNYASHFFEIKDGYQLDQANKRLEVTLKGLEGTDIYYTLDGRKPTLNSKKYTAPFFVAKDADLRAIAYTPSGLCSDVLKKAIRINKATFADIRLLTSPSERYAGDNGKVLVDGVRSSAFHTTGMWVGYNPNPMEAVIDLGNEQLVKQVRLSSLTDMSSYIMGIERVDVEISIDGKNFKQVSTRSFEAPEATMEGKRLDNLELNFLEIPARYVIVRAYGFKALPEGHSGAGHSPFLFVDEIEIN